MKKRASVVSCACVPCKKAQKKCDGNAPCARCVTKKQEADCVLAPQQKRGRKVRAASEEVVDVVEAEAVCSWANANANTTKYLLSVLLASHTQNLLANPQFRPADLARCFNVELGADHMTVDVSNMDFSSLLPSLLSSPVVSQTLSRTGADLFGSIVGKRVAEIFAEKHSVEENLRVFGAMFTPAKAAARRAHVKSFAFQHSKSFFGSQSMTIVCRSKSHVLFDECGVAKLLFVSVYDFFESPIMADFDFHLDVDLFDLLY